MLPLSIFTLGIPKTEMIIFLMENMKNIYKKGALKLRFRFLRHCKDKLVKTLSFSYNGPSMIFQYHKSTSCCSF